MPVLDHRRGATRLDITIFGVRAIVATLSGYTTDHGEYDTLELTFGPDTTVTLAGESVDDLRHLVAALARAIEAPTPDPP